MASLEIVTRFAMRAVHGLKTRPTPFAPHPRRSSDALFNLPGTARENSKKLPPLPRAKTATTKGRLSTEIISTPDLKITR